MNPSEKREIQLNLQAYIDTFSSQRKASESLNDCSEATIIQILKGEWDSISDAKWRSIAKQIVGGVDFSKMVETLNFQTLILYFSIAKEEGATFALVGNGGWGKSYAGKWYAGNNRTKNVYYLECAEYWNKKTFLNKLLQQMGKSSAGMNVVEMMETIIRDLRRQQEPLIILDEVDKLSDPVLKFFITLYNDLNKTCGFIWMSSDAIEKRITRGVNRNTIGYGELFSRIGANFIQLKQPNAEEVREMCLVNGIRSTEVITTAVNEIKELKGDLRRLDRIILREKTKKNLKSLKVA